MARYNHIFDQTPVMIPTTRSRAMAFLHFIGHEHIPYEEPGPELGIFITDVTNGLEGHTKPSDGKIARYGAGTEGFRSDPDNSESATRRGGPFDPQPGGRFAEYQRTGVDPGPEFGTRQILPPTPA